MSVTFSETAIKANLNAFWRTSHWFVPLPYHGHKLLLSESFESCGERLHFRAAEQRIEKQRALHKQKRIR